MGSSRWVRASLSLSRAKKFKSEIGMIYVTAAVSLGLFIYLFAALIRPEWF
ncbi:MAG: K(+)-transporting ATPase subunit F [Verrucomicrobia bacterium]|nr:K(+)-transporting ATPase subunit F [Verrucomicrobiota bacterium]